MPGGAASLFLCVAQAPVAEGVTEVRAPRAERLRTDTAADVVVVTAEELRATGERSLLWRDGSVASVALHRSSGHERLDRAASSAAQSWRFTPRTGSVSLESLLHRVTFRLEDEAGSLPR